MTLRTYASKLATSKFGALEKSKVFTSNKFELFDVLKKKSGNACEFGFTL
jgi:hypothetical protein